MKKKSIIIITFILLFLVTGIGVVAGQVIYKKNIDFFGASKKMKEDKTVVAVVNNDKIYQYQIDIQSASQKLSQTNLVEAGGDPSLVTIQT